MSDIINLRKVLAITLSIIMLQGIFIFALARQASADERRAGRGEFIDSRYNHNHSYPARGGYVRALPEGHRVFMHNNSRYYSWRGVWYRPEGGRFVIVAPPLGLFVPFLPDAYVRIWFGGIPYYYANEVYYTQTTGGYIVVDPPAGDVSQAPPVTEEDTSGDKMFIYPRQGQSEKQQASDRYECHSWAVNQTNYDPTKMPAGIPAQQIKQKRADYQRAMGACLDGRGYTTK
jgi:hypothetical protein